MNAAEAANRFWEVIDVVLAKCFRVSVLCYGQLWLFSEGAHFPLFLTRLVQYNRHMLLNSSALTL